MVCYPGFSRFSPAQDEEDGNKGMMCCWLCLPKPWFCFSIPVLFVCPSPGLFVFLAFTPLCFLQCFFSFSFSLVLGLFFFFFGFFAVLNLYKPPNTATPLHLLACINGTSWAKTLPTFSVVSVESGWRR